jgi:hypothetical protein
MSTPAYGIAILSLTALLGNFSSSGFGAETGKSASGKGGKAAEQMSTKGRLNSNAQWSADPDRGWVRAEERHKLRGTEDSLGPVKQNNGQGQGKGKAKKS